MKRLLLSSLLAPLMLTACLVPQHGEVRIPAQQQSSSSSVAASAAASIRPLVIHTGSAALVGERMLSGGMLEYGAPDAPHTLVVVINYASSYARSFLAEQLPRLAEDFIKQGMLKLRLLPLDIQKYAQSERQSLAMLCAGAQGKGLALNESLATGAPLPEGKAVTALGLDLKAYQTCLTSPDTMRQRGEQMVEVQRLKTTVVPTFFLDGTEFRGLQDYPDLRGRIHEKVRSE